MIRFYFIMAWYFVASVLTFSVYAIDKRASKKGLWRVPEAHLHLLALIGGWPGAMIAQQKLRHKSKKQAFRFVFWITVILNSAGTIWLFTPQGAAILNNLLSKLPVSLG